MGIFIFHRSKILRNLIWKSPGFVPFWTNVTHFWTKPYPRPLCNTYKGQEVPAWVHTWPLSSVHSVCCWCCRAWGSHTRAGCPPSTSPWPPCRSGSTGRTPWGELSCRWRVVGRSTPLWWVLRLKSKGDLLENLVMGWIVLQNVMLVLEWKSNHKFDIFKHYHCGKIFLSASLTL